eukprot:scaffold19513_cov78-Skeletonema_marinoi.AAC.1
MATGTEATMVRGRACPWSKRVEVPDSNVKRSLPFIIVGAAVATRQIQRGLQMRIQLPLFTCVLRFFPDASAQHGTQSEIRTVSNNTECVAV